MLKQLAVSELTPGMLVTRVIEQAGPMKIRKVGMIRSPDMIKGLQEMGVVKVEVDLAQSLSVEFEGDVTNSPNATNNSAPNIYAPGYLSGDAGSKGNTSTALPNTETNKQTATQRLVATNKQVSDVDRQLSQQFHRSLFLPAVDQMPSKWNLYGKPYGYLLGFVLLGLGIGWLGASVPQHFYVAPSTNNAAGNTDDESVLAINPDSESRSLDSLAANKSNSAQSSEELGGNDQTGARGSQTNATENETQAEVAPSISSNDSSALATSEPNTTPSNAPTDDADARQYESVNGVILESGQQVLGYRGSEPEQDTQSSLQAQLEDTQQNQANQQEQVEANAPTEDENPVITNAPGFTTITEPNVTNFNNDLLRRAQRAAELIDSQPISEPEPVLQVTDLNTLPRIDQLTPAILTQMPSMSFSAHMYASNPQDRWVRVNGRRLGEGEYITDGLLIKQIESEKVVLSFRERDFTMNALTDW
jgi:general secretion pathway protein B